MSGSGPCLTLREAVSTAAGQLRAGTSPASDPLRDAETLLLHLLKAPRTLLFTEPDRKLTFAQQDAYAALVNRRLAYEPMQYIIGQQEFYGLNLRVTPAVLIPRPETELLVEAVLQRLPHDHTLRIADVGTGSGAIAATVAANLPQAQVFALDLSAAALEVAQANVATHGLEQRVRLVESDLLAAVAAEDAFDAILSNPPYVPLSDRETLHPQVREYEPALALFAEDDGLAIYRRLIPQAFAALKPGGLLALEIGYGQSAAIVEMLATWSSVEVLDDLQQIPRVVLARRP